MPQIVAAPPRSLLSGCSSDPESKKFNNLALIAGGLARDARGRFAKGSSGNPRGRPPGIPNPKPRIPDLAARPLGAQALNALLDRRPQLLQPLAALYLPPPVRAIDPIVRLGIDLASPLTAADVLRIMADVMAAVASGKITPGEALRVAHAIRARVQRPERIRRRRR
jgi:hypothetical protein